jgi:CO dehydrogenase maturation factor
MTYTIAVTGKGGTGKTTLTGLIVDYLCKSDRTPILVVDADANSNLNEVLGVDVEVTLGELRETIVNSDMDPDSPIPASMSKQDYLNAHFNRALIEEDDYDLLVMGRTQGKGCYCFVNGLLQTQVQRYAGNYKYVVVDNEAGMEHISRGVLPSVDMILLVSDCSRRGIQAAGRIAELVRELKLKHSAMKLIINKAPDGENSITESLREEMEKYDLELAGVVPLDSLVYEYDSEGKPTIDLPPDSPSRLALNEALDKLID